MSYLVSEIGEELLMDVGRFCEEKVKKVSPVYDKTGEWAEELYQEAFSMGYQALEIPETYGGMDIDEIDKGAIFEMFGKADAGFAVTLAAGNLAMAPVLRAGAENIKKEMCEKILEGGVGAFCLTESEAGSDISNIKTTARKEGDYYYINGRKSFVTNGEHAVFYCVAAKMSDGGDGGEDEHSGGFSLFYVDSGQEGIYVERHEDKMGIRLSETCDVRFDNCKIHKSRLIGKEREGFGVAMDALNQGRLWMACAAVGIAQRAMEEAVAYAKTRIQFGKSVLSNQAMEFKVADMAIKIETARQMNAHTLQKKARKLPFEKEASIAKCYSADVAVEASLEAIQMMGGYGYCRDFPAEKLLRDAKIFQIFEGTNEIQRMLIGKKTIKESRK